MKVMCAVVLLLGAGCAGIRELSQADRATSEERELYRKKIEQLFLAESLAQRNAVGTDPVAWTREGQKVREVAPSKLVAATLKLPPRREVLRIEYRNLGDPYWIADAPVEIDRIYEAALRESKRLRRPEKARYFYPDGSSFEAPLEMDVFSHGCAMGLYFYSAEALLYEISGHPESFLLELRHSGEGQVVNAALNAIVQDCCRRSPSYVKEHPDK
jgi:hypothetical protein